VSYSDIDEPSDYTNQESKLFDDYESSFDNSDDSSPFVHEYNGAVSLHFNKRDVQSAMYKHAPHELMLCYTQTMMNFLAFNTQPRHVGMIGLGGGSIPKHCYRHLPDTTISVAEINPEVIALRDYFSIPKDDHRFRVYCEDGADFVRRQPEQFDVLLVDGFDEKGQPPQLCSRQFYSHCYRSLTSPGILVVNVSDGVHLIPRIHDSFRDCVIVSDGRDSSSNTIVFAAKGKFLSAPQRSLKTRGIGTTTPYQAIGDEMIA
jgi:spermidine synthase